MNSSRSSRLYGWTNRLFMLCALGAFATLATARLHTLDPAAGTPSKEKTVATAESGVASAAAPSVVPRAEAVDDAGQAAAMTCTRTSPDENGPWIVLDEDPLARSGGVADAMPSVAAPSVAAALESVASLGEPKMPSGDRTRSSSGAPLALMLADGRLVGPGQLLSEGLRIEAISHDTVLLERDGEVVRAP